MKKLILAATTVLTLSLSAATQYDFVGPGFGIDGGISIISPATGGGEFHQGNFFVGELKIKNVDSSEIFLTFCLSPEGLSRGVYETITFEAAKYGRLPENEWAVSGIENASYLWYRNYQTVSSHEEGAALQLTIWDVLFDSSGVGSVSGDLSDGRFRATVPSLDIIEIYESYIHQLEVAGPTFVQGFYEAHPGFILRADPQSDSQDLIISQPVPEPSTYLGALALCGISLLGLRNKRK
ncbi:MAG: PEP-CTERM sorting domain-containing protein [Verrucomicrobiota bacterium]|nr:PEP-CTERM sorting domain-containing protein [Verrucomicrobiota bacterium]